jgi:hypothetical protein
MEWLLPYVLPSLAGIVVPFIVATTVQYFRKLGWEISDSALATIEQAAENRAGQIAGLLQRGKIGWAEIANVAVGLAQDLIASNPKAAKQTGIDKAPEKAVEKILAKLPRIAPELVIPENRVSGAR